MAKQEEETAKHRVLEEQQRRKNKDLLEEKEAREREQKRLDNLQVLLYKFN